MHFGLNDKEEVGEVDNGCWDTMTINKDPVTAECDMAQASTLQVIRKLWIFSKMFKVMFSDKFK